MTEILEITDKKQWEDFMLKEKPRTFLQSWNWGEFNKAMGHKIWRLGIFENDYLKGAALTMKISARRGTFLFVPHGPVADKYQYRALIDYLKELAAKENCAFVRISPILVKTMDNEKLFRDLDFRPAPIHMHAELVWILDVVKSEEELLKDMRKTTRYSIRKAEADGMEILKSSDPEHLEIFSGIYQKTAERQNFVGFSKNYLKQEFDSFRNDNQILLFLAKYNGEFISGALVVFYGDSAYYHQGASLRKYPQITAPYLLQWGIIREVKARGLRYYNFWGISPEDQPKHPWAGLSLFKRGFGGFSEEYLPAEDLILQKSYWLTYWIEKLRRVKRGL